MARQLDPISQEVTHKKKLIMKAQQQPEWSQNRQCFDSRRWIFRGSREGGISLLDPGCVQSVQSRDWERENTGNISTWVQPCLSPVTSFENFFFFSTGRTENGKLSELVSKEDIHSGGNCAKIARLVMLAHHSLSLTYFSQLLHILANLTSRCPSPLVNVNPVSCMKLFSHLTKLCLVSKLA